jgi:NTP pyrophosphatase (non-canonical NTP hydrolase)
VSKADLVEELGDVLFYVAVLALQLGYTLDQVSEMNYEKLMSGERGGLGYNRGKGKT